MVLFWARKTAQLVNCLPCKQDLRSVYRIAMKPGMAGTACNPSAEEEETGIASRLTLTR